MVKLRLTRTGRKGTASYRVVAIDSRRSRDSKALEQLGYYLPHTKEIKLDKERVEYWLSVGAQPSDTVRYMLVKQGILKKSDLPKRTYKKSPGKKATERAAQKEEAAAKTKEAEKEPAEETEK